MDNWEAGQGEEVGGRSADEEASNRSAKHDTVSAEDLENLAKHQWKRPRSGWPGRASTGTADWGLVGGQSWCWAAETMCHQAAEKVNGIWNHGDHTFILRLHRGAPVKIEGGTLWEMAAGHQCSSWSIEGLFGSVEAGGGIVASGKVAGRLDSSGVAGWRLTLQSLANWGQARIEQF